MSTVSVNFIDVAPAGISVQIYSHRDVRMPHRAWRCDGFGAINAVAPDLRSQPE